MSGLGLSCSTAVPAPSKDVKSHIVRNCIEASQILGVLGRKAAGAVLKRLTCSALLQDECLMNNSTPGPREQKQIGQPLKLQGSVSRKLHSTLWSWPLASNLVAVYVSLTEPLAFLLRRVAILLVYAC